MTIYLGQNRREGDVVPIEERFAVMVQIGETTDECWLWKTRADKKPRQTYPGFKINGKTIVASRWAYEHYTYRKIPEGMMIDHLCNNSLCCNPWHLEPKTSRENTMRGDTPARRNAEKTHCIHGHEYTPENTVFQKSYTNDRLYRHCKTCDRATTKERSARYHAKKKLERLALAA